VFLTSALLDAGEWSASRPCRFIHGEISPRNHLIGGWDAPEPVWTQWRSEKYQTSRKSEPSGLIAGIIG